MRGPRTWRRRTWAAVLAALVLLLATTSVIAFTSPGQTTEKIGDSSPSDDPDAIPNPPEEDPNPSAPIPPTLEGLP